METSILKWLNSLGLSRPIVSLENDFASGFLFAEVLWRLQLVTDLSAFQPSRTPEAQIQNFSLLKLNLERVGIAFSAMTMHNIIGAKSGAAAQLLSRIRTKTESQKMSTNTLQGPCAGDAIPRSAGPSGRTNQKPKATSSSLTNHPGSAASSPATSGLKKHQKPSVSNLRQTYERAEVLDSLDRFETNLQRQGPACASLSGAAAVDDSCCCPASGDVESVLQSMRQRLPSFQSQAEFNSQLLEKLHINRAAQEAASCERQRRRQRILMEQAKKCREALDARVAEFVAVANNRRSPQCGKLISALHRTRQYERVVRCNLEMQKLLLEQQEQQRQAATQRHQQHAATTRSALTDAAIEERARLCHSVRTVRRALKRSRLISDCEVIAKQIVDLVTTASEYKKKYDTAVIAPKVWREWLCRFVSPSDEFAAAADAEQQQETHTCESGLLLHVPSPPPASAVFAPQRHPDGTPALLPPSLVNEFKDYANSEGAWALTYEAPSSFSGVINVPPFPSLADFIHSLNKTQESEEAAASAAAAAAAAAPDTAAALSPSAAPAPAATAGGVAAADAPPTAAKFSKELPTGISSGSQPEACLEPSLGALGRLVRQLLLQTREDGPLSLLPPSPEALVRIIITGKPASGKHELAKQLASRYKLEILCLENIIQEALALARASAAQEPEGKTSGEEHGATASSPANCPASASSSLARLGAQAAQYLQKSLPLTDELTVQLIAAKLHLLFPPKNGEALQEQLKVLRANKPAETNSTSSSSSSAHSKAGATTIPTAGKKGKAASNASPEGPPQESPRCGWVLLGFPTTKEQYALLEEVLSGYVECERRKTKRLDSVLERSRVLIDMPQEKEKQQARNKIIIYFFQRQNV